MRCTLDLVRFLSAPSVQACKINSRKSGDTFTTQQSRGNVLARRGFK